MIDHHELHERYAAVSRSHDTPEPTTKLMMSHLLSGRVCWINPDTTNRQNEQIAAAVPGRCLTASFDGRNSLEQVAAVRRCGATRELTSDTNHIAKPIRNRGSSVTLRRCPAVTLSYMNTASTRFKQSVRELNQRQTEALSVSIAARFSKHNRARVWC